MTAPPTDEPVPLRHPHLVAQKVPQDEEGVVRFTAELAHILGVPFLCDVKIDPQLAHRIVQTIALRTVAGRSQMTRKKVARLLGYRHENDPRFRPTFDDLVFLGILRREKRAGRGHNVHVNWMLAKLDATKIAALRHLWEENKDLIADLPPSARACLELIHGLLTSGAGMDDVARFDSHFADEMERYANQDQLSKKDLTVALRDLPKRALGAATSGGNAT
jgi:hypothetical protein